MLEKLKELLNSPEGDIHIKNYIKTLKFKDNLKEKNIIRIKNMFNNDETFDILVNRILYKHNDHWRNRCYNNGKMPHPWELLYTLFNLVEKEGVIIKGIDGFTKDFPSVIYEYKNWQFAITHGQGSVCSVYQDKKLIYRD